MDKLRELEFIGATGRFRFSGNASKGVLIFYDSTGYVYLPPSSLRDLAGAFAGRSVALGVGPAATRPSGSLGAWLRDEAKVIRDVVPHLAAILVCEGLAHLTPSKELAFPSASAQP